ncbi:hypothetical protein NSK11_contig00097-0010 [Nocardia seriolae]|uniref:Uncharacterized protein n=1 Tax=Nocardia seriolae TaxID=37332 RepID=A0ABC9YZJ8_9NOCA|nr:hypothetical protein C6575_24355 [Nocardia seriolae]GEM26519.1 hypothetical protein NS2_47580 [Nocardia seriolae NBRC 15557]RLP29524.1 hypothetical protein D6158_23400 [Nocardia seriolae]BEK88125.1 hypothetical protein NSERKGN1266_40760 [Nocardia seriolae]BEK95937.1 hypothetical protein NSER024013_38430 [Nocardia seriolae]
MVGGSTAGLLTATAGLLAAAAGTATAIPVPAVPAAPPGFIGAAAVAQPITDVPPVPQHPYLAPNGNSGIHDDGWMSNTNTRPGPLGHDIRVVSAVVGGECGSIAFDRAGRLVTTCIGPNPALYLLDPVTLNVLGRSALPGDPGAFLRPGAFGNFTGGAYFYLDNQDRAVIASRDGHIRVFTENSGGDGFTLARDYDLTDVLRPGETFNSALPDSNGLLWFVARTDGVVGTLDLNTGAAQAIRLGDGADGEIENSFAVGNEGDVYIVTNRELLRFDAGPGGAPGITWRVTYANSGQHKPGQVDDGTGTTPTILSGGYVAITDNADPMNVVVYRTAPGAAQRQVCAVPVFGAGASDTENSLISAGNSLIVENNYGYTGPEAALLGKTTTPGLARIDIDPDGNGCHQVWTNTTEAAPTVVPKLSLATGLVYTYTKGTEVSDPWYLTALDFRTGATVWKQLAGTGPGFNNNYAGIAIGPNGTAYLGVLPGLIALRDN